jgi:hypothetical protein
MLAAARAVMAMVTVLPAVMARRIGDAAIHGPLMDRRFWIAALDPQRHNELMQGILRNTSG